MAETPPRQNGDRTETSPKRHGDITATSLYHHRDITETSPRHRRISPPHLRDICKATPEQDRDITEATPKHLHWKNPLSKLKNQYQAMILKKIDHPGMKMIQTNMRSSTAAWQNSSEFSSLRKATKMSA